MSSTEDQREVAAAKAEAGAEATLKTDAERNVSNNAVETDLSNTNSAVADKDDAANDDDDAESQQPVFFPSHPVELLSEEEITALEAVFKEMNIEGDGILKPKQFVTVLQQQGVDIDEPTLRRHLRMGDGEDVGIDLDDFIQLMAIHLRRKLSVEDARLAFSSFDLNNDGYIDKEELAQAMEMIGFKMTPDEIEEMIREADKDGDGKISFDEFREKMIIFGAGEEGETDANAAGAADKAETDATEANKEDAGELEGETGAAASE